MGTDCYVAFDSCCSARHIRRRQSDVLICRPRPLAQVASSASGSAPIAPLVMTGMCNTFLTV